MKKHIIFALILIISANHLFSTQNEQQSEMKSKDEMEYRALGIAGVFTGKEMHFETMLYNLLQNCYTRHSKLNTINAEYKSKCIKGLAILRELSNHQYFNTWPQFSFNAEIHGHLLNVYNDALDGNVHGVTKEHLKDLNSTDTEQWEREWNEGLLALMPKNISRYESLYSQNIS